MTCTRKRPVPLFPFLVTATAVALLPLRVAVANDRDLPITVKAGAMDGRIDHEIHLEKDVELTQGQTQLKSDKAAFDIIKNEVQASGNVWMRRFRDQYTGDQAALNMDSGAGYVVRPTYEIGAVGGRGEGDRIDFISEDEAVLRNATYSTCEMPNPDWYVRADTLELDSGREVGKLRSGVLYFKDVPIFAAPLLSFPLSEERKSGWLAPTIGMTSTGGFQAAVPYYFNIAPNRDLTLTPKLIARRGLQLGAEGRYLGERYSGTVSVEGMQDTMTKTGRYMLSSQHNQDLGAGWGMGWNLNKASDNDYTSDFSRSVTTYSTQRLLPRDVYMSYSSRYWNLSALASSYQLLQDVDRPIQKPYSRLPQVHLQASRFDVNGFDLELNMDATKFTNDWTAGGNGKIVGGERYYMTSSVSYPFVRPGYFITPKVTFDATSYNLNNQVPGMPTSLNRTVPTVSVDAGMTFERPTQWFGNDMQQTLEPRLFYVRTPYRDQSMYPNFDSGQMDFNFAQMFTENRFVGHDRIGDANQLTAAVISRFAEMDGVERLRIAFGQRYYFTKPQVTLDSSSQTLPNSKSDLLLSVGGQVTKTLSLDSMLQYSETLGQLVKANYGVRWQPAPKKVLNLQYRLDKTSENLKQIDVSGQWPVFDRWYAVGRMNFSIPDHTVAESLLGVEYKADCWVLRIVGQRIPTSAQKASTTFFVQLELNGFSSIGSNPMDALRNNVSGYQKIN